jgi:hypothetical protein
MATVRSQLLEMLKVVAIALEQGFRNCLVFVRGCTTAVFITDPVTLKDVRATHDIDLIIDFAGLAEMGQLLDQLRKAVLTVLLGFQRGQGHNHHGSARALLIRNRSSIY